MIVLTGLSYDETIPVVMSFDKTDTPTEFLVTNAPGIVELEVGRHVTLYKNLGYMPYHTTPLTYCLYCLRGIKNVKTADGQVQAHYKPPMEATTLVTPHAGGTIAWQKVEDKWFLENITDFDIMAELSDAILKLNSLTPDEKKALTLPFNLRRYLAEQEEPDVQGQENTEKEKTDAENVKAADSSSTSPTGASTEVKSPESPTST